MPKPTIFSLFGKDQDKRKKSKKEIDSILTLSQSPDENENYTDQRVRLLDEGAIMRSDGSVRFYITKGAIQEFYDKLDSKYVGYISLAHADLFAMPLSLGYWTKDDLHLETSEDGRTHLDVDLHLNKDMNIVKDILSQDIDLAVSADLKCKYNWELSMKLNTPIVDHIGMDGFAVVGNPGNAASGGIRLSEGETMKLEDFKNKMGEVDTKLAEAKPKEEEKQEEKTEELSAEAQAMLDEIFEKYEKLAQDYTQALEKITALESKVEELSAKPDDKPEEKADDKPKEKLNENPTTEEAIRLFLNSMGTMAANGAQEKTDTPTDPIWGV